MQREKQKKTKQSEGCKKRIDENMDTRMSECARISKTSLKGSQGFKLLYNII